MCRLQPLICKGQLFRADWRNLQLAVASLHHSLFSFFNLIPLSWLEFIIPAGIDHHPIIQQVRISPARLTSTRSFPRRYFNCDNCHYSRPSHRRVSSSLLGKMSDFQAFGGSDEENLEIRKLNSEVVGSPVPSSFVGKITNFVATYRKPTPTASKHGKSLCALARASRAA